jgi:hypothetical protein
MSHTDSRCRRNLACLIAARLCLVISLWQAPVPWLHRHPVSAENGTSERLTLELQKHLSAFHPTIRSPFDQDLGWHCHWVLPSWTHALDNTPDDESPADEEVVFDSALAASLESTAIHSIHVSATVIAELNSVNAINESYLTRCQLQTESFFVRESHSVLRC